MGSIILAFSRPDEAKKIKEILLHYGLSDVRTVTTASAALQEAGRLSHGIVITKVRLPDMYYTELADCLPRYFEILLLDTRQNVSSRREPGLVAVTMPLRAGEFIDTVRMMQDNLDRQATRIQEKKKKRSAKEEQEIHKAKYLLMERNHMTEEEAFRYIQKNSMDTGRNMAETAQMILALIDNEI